MDIQRSMIKDLVLQKDTECYRKFYKLFQQLLKDARVANDSAELTEVPKMQGQIRMLKNLLKELDPSPNTREHYDGGFY